MTLPTHEDVKNAAQRLKGRVKRTPVMTSRLIDEVVGAELFFKCEHLQSTGAFKFRGATHAVGRLSADERRRGVITHSSGNHAQALALAAKRAGVSATIVMPRGSSPAKRAATEAYGARVMTCINTQAERERTCQAEMDRSGAVLIHPYDDARIIAGAGTAALELLDDIPDLEALVVPVGGGGLLAGSALAGRGVNVFGAEPLEANDAYRGLAAGVRVTDHTPNTVADGLRTCLGVLNFEVIRREVHGIGLATESQILSAMGLIHTRMKQWVEPSSALPLACLLNGSIGLKGRVGVILSGGNLPSDHS